MRKWKLWSIHSSSFLLLLAPHTFPLFHHDLIPRLQGNFCSSNWSMSSPTYFVAVDICMAVSHMYFSCLSHSCYTAFLSFLKYVVAGTLPASQTGSILGISGPILESTETDSLQHGDNSSSFFKEATLEAFSYVVMWTKYSCFSNLMIQRFILRNSKSELQLFWYFNDETLSFHGGSLSKWKS